MAVFDPPDLPEQPEVTFRALDDTDSQRNDIFEYAKKGIQEYTGAENATHRIEFADVDYDEGWEQPTLAQEKDAILKRKSLHRTLRGTVRLIDKTTGEVVEEQRMPLAHVPYLNQRGTFIRDGVSWQPRNQLRLRPGIYTRRKKSGEVESHVNVQPGTGRGFRVVMDPTKGQFSIDVGQSTTRLYPALKAMGVTDEQMKEAWGEELFNKNYRAESGKDDIDIQKLLRKLGNKDMVVPKELQAQALKDIVERAEVDEDTTELTMGERVKNLRADVILKMTQKQLALQRGEAQEDNRDSQAYQSFHSVEDFFRERLKRDVTGSVRAALWKASRDGSLKKFTPGIMNKNIGSLFLGSGLMSTGEEVNNLETMDNQLAITRMGEGGISSSDSVSREARNVQASYIGVIDSTRAPESGNIGVDLRASAAALKGSDGQLYSLVRNVKTGEMEKVSARTLSKKIVAFPGELQKQDPRIAVVKNDEVSYAKHGEVDYEIVNPQDMMSKLTQMVPFPEGMKGQRLLMAAKMVGQSLAPTEPEAPLVQVASADGSSLHKSIGKQLGAKFAPAAGVVSHVTEDSITLQTPDGPKEIQIYNNYPLSRKTYIHNTPVVKVGDYVESGQILAPSNFTDKEGTFGLGRNLRVAYMAREGDTIEDAWVLSESAAKKMSASTMYKSDLDLTDIKSTSKDDYVAVYADKYKAAQYDKIGEDGVVQVGQTVEPGDPLILAFADKPKQGIGAVMNTKLGTSSDRTQKWEHHNPGVVTDVVRTKNGIMVTVKTSSAMKPGDKACYSSDTEILTYDGWKFVGDISLDDRLASLSRDSRLEYIKPVALNSHVHTGRMYSLETTQVSLLVTDNHKLYAEKRDAKEYALIEAEDLFGKRYRMRNNTGTLCDGVDPHRVVIEGYTRKCGQFGRGTLFVEGYTLPTMDYAFLIGAFLSEGCLVWNEKSGAYWVVIAQRKPDGIRQFKERIDQTSIRYYQTKAGDFIIRDKALVIHFSKFSPYHQGRVAHLKHVPEHMWSWTPELKAELLKWLMWGDGHRGTTIDTYTTTSPRLSGDVQRLALELGHAANVRYTAPSEQHIRGGELSHCRARYDVIFYYSKNRPQINTGSAKRSVRHKAGTYERWVEYSGNVYCPTLPRNHTVYIRRNGKAVWCGNSGYFGNKGVCGKILPDEQMPILADGKPADIIANPFGIPSRVNVNQLSYALLGKVAAKTGKPYVIPPFSGKNLIQYALDEAADAGIAVRNPDGTITETETVTDPRDGRKINNIFTGVAHFMPLHHIAEAKISARDQASYTTTGAPAKGGAEGAKKVGLLDNFSLISRGATEFIKDAKLVRGQKNDDYWRALRNGDTPQLPENSLADEHFTSLLKAAGVNVVSLGQGKEQLKPMLDRDVLKMAPYEVTKSATLDFDTLEPVKDGLFDIGTTGGSGAEGNKWSRIALPEKIPHPMMTDAVVRILGLTEKKFDQILGGEEQLNGMTGPAAIEKALEGINLDRDIEAAKQAIRGESRTKRDAAVRKLHYLAGLKSMGVQPTELLVQHVPVIPPKYRPIIAGKTTDMIHDLNYLYHDLMEAKNNYVEAVKEFGEAPEEYMTLVKAARAVSGKESPITPKHEEQGVKGVLQYAIGLNDSPKHSVFQRTVIGNAVDTVGRSVITADGKLGMDEIGIPEAMAWKMYRPFIVRRLVREGMTATEALKEVKEQTPRAKKQLEGEMEVRPVVYNRAPSLHRYAYTGGIPKLVTGDAIHQPMITLKSLNSDFDGDAINIHVPTSDEAVKEVYDKFLPSKNLFYTADFETHYEPVQDYTAGLFLATAKDKRQAVQVFKSVEDAKRAYAKGQISARTPIRIVP